MDTAVVIGTYNNAAHVAATIESVRAQTYREWTCVIVDNGSIDDTYVAAEALVAGDRRFALHRKRNEGPASGRNFGLNLLPAEAAFVHFLDGDDSLHSDFLRRLVSYLKARPAVGLVGCQFDVVDANGVRLGAGHRSRYVASRFGWPRALRDDEPETPFMTFFAATGQGPFAVFRRSVLDRTSGYEEDFWSHEDSDIFCQMALLAPVHYLPERLYAKRVHASNLTASPKADYGKFRRKWDNYRSHDPTVNRLIDNALRYYYGRHAPLRHFKVGLSAAREFLAAPNWRRLTWSWQCLRMGIDDLLLRRTLRRRQRTRAATVGALQLRL